MLIRTPKIGRRSLIQGAGFSVTSALLSVTNIKASYSASANAGESPAGTAPRAPRVAFSAKKIPDATAPFMICDTTMADLTNNGRLDFVGANHIGSGIGISLNISNAQPATPFGPIVGFAFHGSGSGPQTAGMSHADMSEESSAGVAYADFNGDGLMDIASSNHPGSVGVFVNSGAATGQPSFQQGFVAELAAIRDGQPGITTQGTAGVEGGLAVGDFNGDGRPDIVTANLGNNTIAILLNTTAKGEKAVTFSGPTYFSTAEPTISVSVADLNNDGKPDIVAVNTAGKSISVLINKTAPGSATPEFATHADYQVGAGPSTCAIADLDGDGNLDVITSNWSDKSVSVLAGKGDGSFHPAITIPVGEHIVVARIADFNGDGKPDIVAIPLNPRSQVAAIFLMNQSTLGKISFAEPVIVNLPEMGTGIFSGWAQKSYFTTSGAVGDVNGDGKPELVVAVAYYPLARVLPVADDFMEFARGPFGIDVPKFLLPQSTNLVLVTSKNIN
jgi:hypothetical protein